MSDLTISPQRWRYRPPTKMVDGAMWRCQRCGWLGDKHFHVDGALREGMAHMKERHPELEQVDVEVSDV